MLEYIITFFQVLFEELSKLFKPKPTAEQLELLRKFNISTDDFWNVVCPNKLQYQPLRCCEVCMVMYRCCPLQSCIFKQRRQLPYKATYCPATVRLEVGKYK